LNLQKENERITASSFNGLPDGMMPMQIVQKLCLFFLTEITISEESNIFFPEKTMRQITPDISLIRTQ